MKQILLAGAVLAAFTLKAQSPEFKKHVEAGNAQFGQKNYSAAVPHYDKAIELIENDAFETAKSRKQNKALAEVYSKRAVCYYSSSSISALKSDADMALALDSTNADAKLLSGYGVYKSGDKRKGCAGIRSGLIAGAEYGNKIFDDCFCWSEGVNLAKEGDSEIYGKRYDNAIKLLNQAIAIIPDSGYIYAIRAKAWMGKEENEKAMADMNSAVYKKASNYKVYYQRAQTFVKTGKPDSAFLDLNKCLSLKPNYEDGILLRAQVAEETGQWNAAIFDYNALIKLQPSNGRNFYRIAIIKHTKQDDLFSACEYYKAAAARGLDDAKEMAANCDNKKYMKQHLHKAGAEPK